MTSALWRSGRVHAFLLQGIDGVMPSAQALCMSVIVSAFLLQVIDGVMPSAQALCMSVIVSAFLLQVIGGVIPLGIVSSWCVTMNLDLWLSLANQAWSFI